MSKSQDPARKWGIHKEGDPANILYCKYCNHKITAEVTRLKHHLAGTHMGVAACKLVPADVKKANQDAFKAKEREKTKKVMLMHEIGRMGEEEGISGELESEQASNSQNQDQSRTLGPIDQFVNVQPRQTTIESRLKKERRELAVRKIRRFIYANGLSFNILNSPYWKDYRLQMRMAYHSIAFLLVLRAVIEITDYRFILFSAGYEPLDAAILLIAYGSSNLNELPHSVYSKHGTLLFNNRLFCFSGWLFPRCSVVIHHGGSGSTAAALHAGTPQIVCPFLLDQFYWAERLFWLGVAPEPLRKEHLVPDSEDARSIKQAVGVLSLSIKKALSPGMKDQASRVSERISSEDGAGEAVKILKDNVTSTNKEEDCSLQN